MFNVRGLSNYGVSPLNEVEVGPKRVVIKVTTKEVISAYDMRVPRNKAWSSSNQHQGASWYGLLIALSRYRQVLQDLSLIHI